MLLLAMLLLLLLLPLLLLLLNITGVGWLLSLLLLLRDEARLSMEPDLEGKELLWNKDMCDGGCAEGLLYE